MYNQLRLKHVFVDIYIIIYTIVYSYIKFLTAGRTYCNVKPEKNFSKKRKK